MKTVVEDNCVCVMTVLDIFFFKKFRQFERKTSIQFSITTQEMCGRTNFLYFNGLINGTIYSMEWSFGVEKWSGLESNFGVAN